MYFGGYRSSLRTNRVLYWPQEKAEDHNDGVVSYRGMLRDIRMLIIATGLD